MLQRLMTMALWTGALAAAAAPAAEWPQWRGPFNSGMAVGDAPLRWDDSTNVNSCSTSSRRR
jgi:hypothetical protein